MSGNATIVWFRHDLRLDDNPALTAARKRGGAVVPVFIWAPDEEGNWPPGAASRWWLHRSLESLDADLRALSSRLILRRGETYSQIERLINETGADAIYWNRRYEPAVAARDSHIEAVLAAAGVEVRTFNSALLFEPDEIATKQGKPYQVFTPFWKTCLSLDERAKPLPAIGKLPSPRQWPQADSLDSLELNPTINWDAGLRKTWKPGARAARKRLREFVATALSEYDSGRDAPAVVGTSRLSPHLHFGEIGPRQVWHAIKMAMIKTVSKPQRRAAETFLKELGWREFAHHVLHHFPQTTDRPLRPQFENFQWETDAAALRAWQTGRTGYPIVDAGMRELWATGWMHNRVRMIVGSFLTKDLRIAWLEGAKWFWDTLVDADLANNTLGWQWVSGSGADAAPYFRVFNPVTQGEKFDREGEYVRRWVPELKNLPARWIHQPWTADDATLRAAGVELGTTYPRAMVDHAAARRAALEAFSRIKGR